jgi:predicted RNase H-like HicB family nuclease
MTEQTMNYLVIIEQGEDSWGAYVPDLPGCVAIGETEVEVEARIQEAIQLHLDGMRQDNEPIPMPKTHAYHVDVAA